jgi:hypothetical protein
MSMLNMAIQIVFPVGLILADVAGIFLLVVV